MKDGWRSAMVFFCTTLVAGAVLGGRSVSRSADDALGAAGWDKWAIRVAEPAQRDPAAFAHLDELCAVATEKDETLLFEGRARASLRSELGVTQGEIRATTSALPLYASVKLVGGAFFTPLHEAEHDRVLVLSESLARELFRSTEVLGLRVTALGMDFRVIGVTEEDRSLLGSLAAPEAQVAYVPLRSVPGAGAPLHVDVVQARRQGDFTPESLLRLAQADPAMYAVVDYQEQGLLLTQAGKMPAFVCGVFSILLLFSLVVRVVRRTFCTIRQDLGARYLSEAVREHAGSLAARGAIVLLAIAAVCLVARLTLFLPYIPPARIPASLADFGFYRNLVRQDVRALLSGLELGAPEQERYIRSCLLVARRLSFVALAGCAGLVAAVSPLGRASYRAVAVVPFSLFASFLLVVGALVAAGLPIVVEIRSVVALWILVLAASGCAVPEAASMLDLREPPR